MIPQSLTFSNFKILTVYVLVGIPKKSVPNFSLYHKKMKNLHNMVACLIGIKDQNNTYKSDTESTSKFLVSSITIMKQL